MKEQPQELVDSYRSEGLWTDRLLTDFLDTAVERSPDKMAVVDERFEPITYAQLAREVSRLAAALQVQGISRGDKFIIALPNSRVRQDSYDWIRCGPGRRIQRSRL